MAEIKPIFFPLCQQSVGEASLKWRRLGMATWGGPDIILCGAPATFTVDGTPTCKRHVRRFTAHAEPISIDGEGQERIFSGDASRKMWDSINSAKTIKDLRYALYGVGCKLQEFEVRVRDENRQETKDAS